MEKEPEDSEPKEESFKKEWGIDDVKCWILYKIITEKLSVVLNFFLFKILTFISKLLLFLVNTLKIYIIILNINGVLWMPLGYIVTILRFPIKHVCV